MANPLIGQSEAGDAVFGVSDAGRGVVGVSKGRGAGVEGNSASGAGVVGISETGRGVVGIGKGATGVEGNSASGAGIAGISEAGIGVLGKGGQLAALFQGDVEVTGDLRLTNADCAEDFDVAAGEGATPGTVMVLGPAGYLQESRQPYDKKVAGVVSGAGRYRPGLILDRHDTVDGRMPVALMGKVYCMVDASYGQIETGDLLTTSGTPGHAMKASDPHRAFGAVIGKALKGLESGSGLIPILVSLQ